VSLNPNDKKRQEEPTNEPTGQVGQKEALEVTVDQKIVNHFVRILTEDLKSGALQFAGTPYDADEFFRILVLTLTDRFYVLADKELSEKLSEIRSLIASDANYDDVIAKLNEAHNLMVTLLLAYERAVREIAGISAMKT
jgi:hypothetical protein